MKNSINSTHKNHTGQFSAKIMIVCIVTIMSISFISAMDIDNRLNDKITTIGRAGYKNIEINNAFGLGNKLWSGTLDKNSEVCSDDCIAEQTITLYQPGVLIEDIIFERIYDDGERREAQIRSYQVYIDEDPYELGTELPTGTYNVRLEGSKSLYQNIDWIYKTQGETLNEWAKWGTINSVLNYTFDNAANITENTGINPGTASTDTGMVSMSGDCIDSNCVATEDKKFSNTYNTGITTGGVSFWIRLNVDSDDLLLGGPCILKHDGAGNFKGEFSLGITSDIGTCNSPGSSVDGSFHIFYNNVSGTQVIETTGKILADNWYHVFYKINASDIGIYLNGVKNASGYGSTNQQMFGAGNTNYFLSEGFAQNMSFDEFRIYDTEITDAQILDIYNTEVIIPDVSVVNSIPLNDSKLSNNSITFGCNATGINGVNITSVVLNVTGVPSWTQTITGLNQESYNATFINSTLVDGIYNWTCLGIGNSANGTSAGWTFTKDTLAPSITINLPMNLTKYGYLNKSEELNWTINDTSFDSAWYNYNGTNITLNGAINSTNFLINSVTGNNLTFWANDSVGNVASNYVIWNYTLFQINQSFNNVTFSSAEETFILDFLLDPSISITSAVMDYNGTNYTSNIASIGEARRLSNTINVPTVDLDTNFTFKFFVTTSSQLVETFNSTQLVSPINMTDCVSGGTVILNMSLFDEEMKTNITGDIEINAQAIDKSSLINAGAINFTFNNTHNAAICVSLTEALPSLYLDAEIRYTSENYATELYHIQRADLTDAPINLSLFDLLSNDSTEFLVTYQDDDLILVSGAVIQLQRKYIAEDLYEVVEAPLTSDSGTAVVHIDLNTNKYRATIVKDGEVLDFFDNIVFNCESELSGQCTHELLGDIDPQNDVPVETIADFAYTITQVNDTITTTFSIPSGVPSSVNVYLNQIDQFNNSYPCNQTVFSSAGSIDCNVTTTIGDSFLELTIKKADELQAQKSYVIQENAALSFLGNNYFILFILMLSVVGMAFTSPEWIIINGVLTMVIAGGLYLANGLNFVIGLGNLIWLVIAAVILIFKLAHQEDR